MCESFAPQMCNHTTLHGVNPIPLTLIPVTYYDELSKQKQPKELKNIEL